MFYFPLLNFLFLIILYRIHTQVFWATLVVQLLLHIVGFWYIYTHFTRPDNQFIYTLALTGIGFVIVLLSFFIAAFLNQRSNSLSHE